MLVNPVSSCKKTIPNNPESVAIAVIESLIVGDCNIIKKYATDDVARMIDTTTINSIFKQADILKNMQIERYHVSEKSYDGTVKDVDFTMCNGNNKTKVCITVVDVNGKWLYDNIQYK